jgi:hypothetical protein
LSNQVRWNPLADLTQNGEFRTAWLTFLFFHPCLVAGVTNSAKPFSFRPMGWL